jgi:hypothetical protein
VGESWCEFPHRAVSTNYALESAYLIGRPAPYLVQSSVN